MDLVSKTWSCIKALIGRTIPDEGHAGDGREEVVLKEVLETAENTPESVLQVMDKFAQKSWLMNVGDRKGVILTDALIAANPKVVLELGAYVGYSATLMASKLRDGGKIISVEMSTVNVEIATKVVNHAGLGDRVEFVNGILTDKIEEVKELLHAQNTSIFDFVFIDHGKRFYLSDMLLLKEHGLIGKGTVLVADNMGIPGSPLYREHMKTHPDEYDTVEHKTNFEYFQWLPDSIFISTCKFELVR